MIGEGQRGRHPATAYIHGLPMPWVQCWSLHLRKDVLELEKVPRGLIKCVGQLCMSNNMVGWNWKRDKQTVHNVLLVPAHAIAKGDQRKPV